MLINHDININITNIIQILTQSVNLLLIVAYILGNVEEVEFNVYKNIALWKASGDEKLTALRYSRRDVKYLNASNANITLSSRPRLHFYRTQNECKNISLTFYYSLSFARKISYNASRILIFEYPMFDLCSSIVSIRY